MARHGRPHPDNWVMRSRVVHQGAVWAVLSLLVSPYLLAADCGSSRYDCAVYYVGRHDFSAATQALNEELQVSPRNLKALNLFGIVLTESGHIEAGNSKFKEALRIDPDFYFARKNLAINEFNLHRLQDAQADLDRVLKSSPSDPIAHVYLAEISFQKRNYAA